MMNIIQTRQFYQAIKKLHKNQKLDLDIAVQAIIANITIGDMKVGDLAGVRVHKFRMCGQLTLLAYTFNENTVVLTLLTFGSHENFYRDIKK